jgi:hypothetical protein
VQVLIAAIQVSAIRDDRISLDVHAVSGPSRKELVIAAAA